MKTVFFELVDYMVPINKKKWKAKENLGSTTTFRAPKWHDVIGS